MANLSVVGSRIYRYLMLVGERIDWTRTGEEKRRKKTAVRQKDVLLTTLQDLETREMVNNRP